MIERPQTDDDHAGRHSLYLDPDEPYVRKWPAAVRVGFVFGVSVGLWVAILCGVAFIAHLAKVNGLLG